MNHIPGTISIRVKNYKGDDFKPLRNQNLEQFRLNCKRSYIDHKLNYKHIVSEDINTEFNNTIRIYKNKKHSSDVCFIYVFAGGFIEGCLDSQDAICRYISNKTDNNVIAIGYSIAPEHKYPTAHEQIYKTLNLISCKYNEYKKISLVGYSSGANLVNHSLNKIISSNENAKICSIHLIAPFLSFCKKDWDDIKDVMLDVQDLEYMRDLYIESDTDFIKASPFYFDKEIVSKYPKVFIYSMKYDPLSKLSYKYYRKLSTIKGDCYYYEYPFIHLEFALTAIFWQENNMVNPLNDLCSKLNTDLN